MRSSSRDQMRVCEGTPHRGIFPSKWAIQGELEGGSLPKPHYHRYDNSGRTLVARRLAKNPRTLSTSASAKSIGVERDFSRPGACDRGIWRKPLRLRRMRESYKYIVWVFNARFAILSPESCQLPSFVEKESLGTAACYHSRQKKLAYTKTAARRTRGSVRRASGFVQILLSQVRRRETVCSTRLRRAGVLVDKILRFCANRRITSD